MSQRKRFSLDFPLIFAASVLALAGHATHAAEAGRVLSASGQVQAVDASGQARALNKNDTVNAGDTLRTGEGRAQVHFADGGMIALNPGTQFRIDEYNYSGSEDGTERSIFSLLKGGFRAISGAIGHRNPQTYRVNATVATIGIRGTAFQALLCDVSDEHNEQCRNRPDGLHTQTDEGTTFVFNDAGSLDVPSGRGAYVKDANTPPVYSDEGQDQGDLISNVIDDSAYRAGENINLQLPTPPPTVPSGPIRGDGVTPPPPQSVQSPTGSQ
jgi:hypothetical protein